MIILGESLLNLKTHQNISLIKLKNFLQFQNKKISEEWNSFNILSCDAATVGNLILE
jgi:NADH-quinone oxidoreductase subunit G